MEEIIKKLIVDEKEAVEAYSKAIEELADKPDVIAVLERIKGEEEEHIKELDMILDGEPDGNVEELKRLKELGI